jgi:hypothetical protein
MMGCSPLTFCRLTWVKAQQRRPLMGHTLQVVMLAQANIKARHFSDAVGHMHVCGDLVTIQGLIFVGFVQQNSTTMSNFLQLAI